MRSIVLTIASLIALIPSVATALDPVVIEAQQRRIAVVKKVAPSVVCIFGKGGQGGGSGVLISPDGYALTNFHVTRGAGDFMKCGLNDGVLYDAVIVGIDPTGDVAVIRLLGREDFPVAPLGDSDKLKVGDWAYAMGNPFLLATDFQATVTYGIVSGLHRYQYPAGTILEYTDCIQIDTSINPGNSGGPLFNDNGELVGINGRGSFEKRGRVNSGAGYAISINQIKYFMDHLKSGRVVDHATLGATVTTGEDGSVIVDGILSMSEAFRRGVRQDDELVSFAGRPMRSVNQFKNVLGIYPKGWKVPLVYRREGETVTVYPRLRGLHRKSELTPKKKPAPKPKQPGPDGKKPEGKKPTPKLPIPVPGGPKPTPPPAKYKHMFVKKDGFANYYFNKVELDRVMKSVTALGDFSSVAGTWQLKGTVNTGDPFEFTLAQAAMGLTIGDRAFIQQVEDIQLEKEPPGTSGLLVAARQLKLMLTGGFKVASEIYYLGSEPLDGTGEVVDVVITVEGATQCRWYFSKDKPALVGFDTQVLEDSDDCEVRFQEFKEFEGRKLPSLFLVRSAGRDFLTFRLENVVLNPTPKATE
ncbi:MAG: trypsin-like peptidase domain-containing protein [Planctomycetota bacterium]|nr:trypsin-like peptidase domain-containing protein [Planctomycetota bacterium]